MIPARVVGGLLIAAPALAFYALIAANAINVPYLDDYDTVLLFLEGPASLQDWFAPHVEHRPVVLRLVAEASAALSGSVDFRVLAFVGNAGVLALAVVLYRGFRPTAALPVKSLAFVPAAWFLFQPQSFDSIFWATSSLSNGWVLALCGAGFLALENRRPTGVALAALCVTFAVGAQANGLVALPVAFAVLVAQRRTAASPLWLVFATGLSTLYALGLAPPDGHPGVSEALSSPGVVPYALGFLGAVGGLGNKGTALAVGAALLLSTLFLSRTGLRHRPVLPALLWVVIGSAVLNALGREFIAGPEFAVSTVRYRSYGAAALACAYLAWVQSLAPGSLRKAFVAAGISAGVAFGVASFAFGIERSTQLSKRLEVGMHAWPATSRGLRHPDSQYAAERLERAVSVGRYRPPRTDDD
ncbi:MAG: hypothetical protein VCC02_08950 [Myxococcota bacterium]